MTQTRESMEKAANCEKPCIADAAKNFLAVLIAGEFAETSSQPASLPQLQACARVLLKAVNGAPLPGCFAVPDPGVKPTRAFGRSLLASPGHWDAIVALARGAPGSAAEGLDQFVHGFHRSFADGVVQRNEVELGELIWAVDFSAALRERGARRRARTQVSSYELGRVLGHARGCWWVLSGACIFAPDIEIVCAGMDMGPAVSRRPPYLTPARGPNLGGRGGGAGGARWRRGNRGARHAEGAGAVAAQRSGTGRVRTPAAAL
jgi:hypothetical protein